MVACSALHGTCTCHDGKSFNTTHPPHGPFDASHQYHDASAWHPCSASCLTQADMCPLLLHLCCTLVDVNSHGRTHAAHQASPAQARANGSGSAPLVTAMVEATTTTHQTTVAATTTPHPSPSLSPSPLPVLGSTSLNPLCPPRRLDVSMDRGLGIRGLGCKATFGCDATPNLLLVVAQR
jgi:hypothetical protein